LIVPFENVNDEKAKKMIKKKVNNEQNKLVEKNVGSLEKQKKEMAKLREELKGRLDDLSESEIAELVSQLMSIKKENKRIEKISQMKNLIKDSKIPFKTELGK